MTPVKEVLAKSALFKELNDQELEKIADMCRQEVYPEGATIFSESTLADDLYIVDEGKVAVEMKLSVYPGLMQQATVEVILPGDAFGWSAVIGSRVYTMSAKSAETAKVTAIDGDRLRDMLDEDHSMGYRVMEGLVEVVSARVRSVKRTILA